MAEGFAYRYRRAPNTPEFRQGRPRAYGRTIESGMIVERDVEVTARDGAIIYADIFRPADATGPLPVLIAWTPYGKHDPVPLARIYPDSGVHPDWCSDYTIFEAPDPVFWTRRGYATINAEVPGTWYANSRAHFLAPEEAEAYYDLIEWAGVQAWSNGKVGLSGVSYLTSSQWRVAELHPPHLAAINPWEGWTDTYREIAYHGGIPETHFWPYIQTRWGVSDQIVEDLWAETHEHPFFDAFWQSKAAQLERIECPAYVCASWSDQGVHCRGTLEGFKRIASREKWLEVHGNKKWAHYYDPDSLARQLAFFDHYLKGETTDLENWPPVRLEVRSRAGERTLCGAAQWPVEDTHYVPLYLDAAEMTLSEQMPTKAAQASYDPVDDLQQLRFDHRFAEAATLVGHMKLRLHVEAPDADDLDLFVAIEKIDYAGERVPFVHYGIFSTGPVAVGWLRASHRELDEAASTEYQPVLAHRRALKIEPGEIVPVDIEILPSGTSFEAGETLRLVIAGRDIHYFPKPLVYMHHENSVNRGRHVVYTGGDHPSYLLIPKVRLTELG